ncbi:hypothetical protein GJAV_G00036270 [Gymnothorax javanicus]|nr:hypothetical protein GJAV_G00036270 [Gymnothorax javanicus]
MSTDDSISEDASTSAALSPNNADVSGGKESEASVISSEETLSGAAGSEEERGAVRSVLDLQGFFQCATGAVMRQSPPTYTSGGPCKSRGMRLDTAELGSGRCLHPLGPGPLETLTALLQEIGEGAGMDPALWKDSQERWLQLFTLVEKQYQEQILTQQEQYQCQIQLIQDKIKSLIQLQNRPMGIQPADDSLIHTPADSPLSDPAPPVLFPSATPSANTREIIVDRASPAVIDSCHVDPEHSLCQGEGGCGGESDEQPATPDSGTTAPPLAEEEPANPLPSCTSVLQPPSPADQSGTGRRVLTSWAKREKRSGRRRMREHPLQEEVLKRVQEQRSRSAEQLDPIQLIAPPPQPFFLKYNDTLDSQASGLGSRTLGENKILCPRPDALGSRTSHPVQEASVDQCFPGETRLLTSLREIYLRRQREARSHDPSSFRAITSLSQVHSAAQVRRPGCTLSFAAPPCFSGGSFPAQSHSSPLEGAPRTPTGPVFGHPDGSFGAVFDRTSPQGLDTAVVPSAAPPSCGADPWLPPHSCVDEDRSPAVEDPVILSLARQSMREKTSRHIADLRTYYESEISALKEKLNLANQRPRLEEQGTNQILQDRCETLERSIRERGSRARGLEEQILVLERQLSEWQERYDLASAMVTTLQQQLEAASQSCREREAEQERWKARVRQLEEANLQACEASFSQDTYRAQEHRMLQELIAEYETLGKDHERVKDKLVSTEGKLFDALEQISELKRVVSKLETQVKQLEWESGRTLHPSRSRLPPSTPGRCPSPERERVQAGPLPDGPPRRETSLVPLMKALILMDESSPTGSGAPHRPDIPGPGSIHKAVRRSSLRAPLGERSSPKRSPSENISTAFGHSPFWRRHSHTWSDVRLDHRAVSSPSPSLSSTAKNRLRNSVGTEAHHQPISDREGGTGAAEPIERAEGESWEEQGAVGEEAEPTLPSTTPLPNQEHLWSLTDMERLFDQLTLEKQQIEAALSRLPSPAGGRGGLQAKLEEEALEGRLENVNRELGSIRMTLKKFHVLRSSANIYTAITGLQEDCDENIKQAADERRFAGLDDTAAEDMFGGSIV